MLSQSLGDKIRSIREQQNLSREQLYARTKILVRYIEAIEEGRWDLLPGQVYLKPFVKNIAEACNVDYKELYALIDKTEEKEEHEIEKPPQKRFDYRWLAIALMILLVCLVIFILRPLGPDENATTEESSGRITTPDKNEINERPFSSNLDIQRDIISADAFHTLELSAIDSVWLMLTAGNDTLYIGILAPGRHIKRQSTGVFELVMGRSNCLNIVYDNTKLDSDGYLRGRRRLVFSDLDRSMADNNGGRGEG